MIEPLIDEVQLAHLALQKTEKRQYVAHSKDLKTPALKRTTIESPIASLGAI